MPEVTIKALVDKLYQDRPHHDLSHYTSLSGMMGIVSSKCFWASEIRYLNDSSELKHLQQLVTNILVDSERGTTVVAEISRQFELWLRERVNFGPRVFVVSFTERPNLLSQWRGYTPFGQGVSLSFRSEYLSQITDRAAFRLGRCVYDPGRHIDIVVELINSVVGEAKARGPSADSHPSQSYHPYFTEVEEDILSICALLKNNAFAEENEWRAVSRSHSNYVDLDIKYRSGSTFLIPYIELPLSRDGKGPEISYAVVGPSPTPDLLNTSVAMYLNKYAPDCGTYVSNCQIPYRG